MRFSWSDSSVARPKIVITAEDADDDFDEVTVQNWRAEGFEVSYLPFTSSRKEYVRFLQHLADPLELGENFAIVGLLALMGIKSNRSYWLTFLRSLWRSGLDSTRCCDKANAKIMRLDSILSLEAPCTQCSVPHESQCYHPLRWFTNQDAQLSLLLLSWCGGGICGRRS